MWQMSLKLIKFCCFEHSFPYRKWMQIFKRAKTQNKEKKWINDEGLQWHLKTKGKMGRCVIA